MKSKTSPDQSRDDNLGAYDLDNPVDKEEYCPDSQVDDGDDYSDELGGGASFGDFPHETAEPGTSKSMDDDGVGDVLTNEATLDNDALLQQPYKVRNAFFPEILILWQIFDLR